MNPLMFAPAPDTAAFVSELRTVTNSARSRLVTLKALTDCVGGGGERREELVAGSQTLPVQ